MNINSKEDIINYFLNGNKKNFFIGVENEKFLFDVNTKKRCNYDQIKNILVFLHNKFGWKKVEEHQNLIGLSRDDQQVTLEPGNQIELAGSKLQNIHEVCSESYKFQNELEIACKKFNLEIMSLGFDPVTKLSQVPSNPKKRYSIMKNEMPKGGKMSLDMMYQTAGTQINLDYSNEKNFTDKFKLISYLTPISIALFANSSLKENSFTNYLSYRSLVWQNTSRGGLPEIFLEEMNFEKYADFCLNMPLLFILKDGNYISSGNFTFKDFVQNKIKEINKDSPTIIDLKNHLSTIFTEVRLKQYLEIRSIDACEWDCHCASPAFYTGLLYGNLDEALDIIKKWKPNEVLNAYFESPKKCLFTELHGKKITDWAKIFLNICKSGLSNRNILNKKGSNENIYLKNIENILAEEKTKAEKSIKIA